MNDIPGVDLALYQGVPAAPIKAIVNDGAKFVICKASQATFGDPSFAGNAVKLAATNAVKGAYHFLSAGNGAAQADFFVKTVKMAWPQLDAVLWLDVERVPDPQGDPHPGADDPDYADVKAFVKRFQQIAPKHPLCIYTSHGYWNAIGNPDASALECELALAYYVRTGAPKIGTFDTSKLSTRVGFGGWRTAAFRQFGPVSAGGLRAIDGDFFRGTAADLRALTGVVPPKPQPIPLPERPNYRNRHNELLDAIAAALPNIQLPNPPQGVGGIAGVAAAREEVADALESLKLREAA